MQPRRGDLFGAWHGQTGLPRGDLLDRRFGLCRRHRRRIGARHRERAPPPHPAAGEYGIYQIKSGDCLTEIAQRVLGSSKQWRTLYELNRQVIRDPDEIPVGAVIKFPRSHNSQ
jgi:hypothetical protein